jgi:hypothetical protein
LNITVDSLLLHLIYTVACWKDLLINQDMLSFFISLNRIYRKLHDLSASDDIKGLAILKSKIPELVDSKTKHLDLRTKKINNQYKYIKVLQKDVISEIIKFEISKSQTLT